MRYFLVLLIALAVCLLIPTAPSAETLLGKVIAIDMERGEMTIQLIHPPNGDADAEPIIVTFPAGDLPAGIETGSIIRVWGGYMDGHRIKFQCSSIRMGGPGPGNDPTGVRSRIGRSCDGRGSSGMPRGGPGHGR
jgi:hypothetical protein